MNELRSTSLLWIGAGDIATRAYPLLDAQKLECQFVSRKVKFIAPGIRSHAFDITEYEHARCLAETRPAYCVITMTPGGRREEDYRSSYLACVDNWLRALASVGHMPKRVLFTSSSSVYHQDQGERVDEHSATQPARANGKVLLECEDKIRNSDFTSTIVRFSGIYGPGRYHLLKQVAAGKLGGASWTNRIHAQDCARVMAFLIDYGRQNVLPECVLASDECPIRANEIRPWLADAMGLTGASSSNATPASTVLAGNGTEITHKAATLSLGKRCDSERLRSLGFQFQYPSYREGFPEVIKAFRSHGR